jgi:hypothetical protein
MNLNFDEEDSFVPNEEERKSQGKKSRMDGYLSKVSLYLFKSNEKYIFSKKA